MPSNRYPSAVWTTPVVILAALAWGALRLAVSVEHFFPFTFVLPLLVCVWTRRRWHVWMMAAIFGALIVAKLWWVFPAGALADRRTLLDVAAAILNVTVGAAVVHVLLAMRDRYENAEVELQRQHAELAATAVRLQQQVDESHAQAHELLERNAEIESQAEEFERQNEELHEMNERLASREEVLQAAVEGSRQAGGARAALESVCGRTLAIVGAPAEAVALLELIDGRLRCRVQATVAGEPRLSEEWPLQGSLAQIVLEQDRTAYVDDLQRRPDLSAPLDTEGRYRSALVTPVRLQGKGAGVLVLCSREVAHWTQEQFRLIEWTSAQLGPLVESMRWQEELRDQAIAADAANRAKDDFLAMLSHELRTPLTPVMASASAMERDLRLPADVRAELAMIQRNVAVQSRLIDDLLDLTRIARGRLEVKPHLVGLATLLQDAVAIVASDAQANNQHVDLELDLRSQAAVLGDAARLQQVVWNLLKNALKFSPPSAHIVVSAQVRPGHPRRPGAGGESVVIRVRDEGVGIEAADLERIFEPFEQAAAGRRRGSALGLGLGLSIARAIVELHDGTLRATSEGVGQGAVFIVELPLATRVMAVAAETPAQSSPVTVTTDFTPLRILLVEDHDDTGLVLTRLLRRTGHMVVYEKSLAGAREAWKQQAFDLVISDLGLPDGSGLDLMREIRLGDSSVPGICMSGFGMESDHAASRTAGFTEHLTKPVDLNQLRAAIQRLNSGVPS